MGRKKPGNAVANPWSVSTRGGQYKVQYAGRARSKGKPAAATAVDAKLVEKEKGE